MLCIGKKSLVENTKGFPLPASCSVGSLDEFLTDGNASFLRAARSGNLEKILEHLKGSIDINTCNANGLNALHLAAKEGHVIVVTELLKKGANVNAATKKGNTALHIASLAGQEEVVKVLVNLGANVNVQSQNGFTPLYMAAQENHDAVVSFLLASGANQGLATEDGFTPLAVALQQGHDRVVAVLLENDTKGKVRLPALHIAAKKDDCKAASLLLQSDHNPDITSKSGFTPLHIAAHYGNENIAKILLSKGADVNYAAKHQITPLHVASKWGKTNMVSLLLQKGANIESSTRDGLTPLHCSARSGHDQVVDLLLEKGAPFLAKTKNGLAPLHMASQGDHVDSARILLFHKVPVDDVTVDYLTALHVAAHCGHVKVAKLLLDRKADPNARALNGFTPLHIACKKNRIKVVELLLKHGASIEATTESGLTPLHVASFMGCMNIVIYLIQNGANPDVPTVRGETPLHLAARANQTDIIRILLRNGASVDARAREEQTPLHIAARLGNADIVSLLLQHGAAVDATTKDLYTALHIAAKEDQEEVATYLLDHGASLTATTKKGFTPLHLAAKYGNIKVARLLIKKLAPIDAQGKNGVTPLHVAAHYDHVNIALLLLDKGASPHAVAKNGYTPLHIAAKKNQMDIASTLLEYHAKPNAESKAGFIPLHLSSQEGHADMSSLLIEHKSGVNHKANNGLTPLHLCAQDDRVNVAAILVKNGAEIGPQTKAGYTPLHVASHFGQMNMVRFLLQHGASVHTTTTHGYTSLHQAAQQGQALVVNLLLENEASPNVMTTQGQTPLSIAQRLGYISVVETLKVVTETTVTTTTTTITEEKYKVVAPETMQETFMTDSEDEGGADFDEAVFFGKPPHATHIYLPYVRGTRFPTSEEAMLGDQSYRYLTADEMKSLGDDSLPIDVTKDERQHEALHAIREFGAPMVEEDNLSPQHVMPVESGFSEKFSPDNVDLTRAPVHAGFLVSFMVDARGGAMRGCRHSGVRVIIPPRKASMPMRITCRYLRKEKLVHPPPLMEGEACASRILEMGPVGARFLGPVILEVPHFAASRGREREITILRSDTGESWREHTLEASEEAVQEVLNESFEGEELSALEDLNTNRITRILTTDFPQYFAIVTRVRQEVHGVGPEGGMLSSTVVPQVQAIFPEGALTKKIRVGLQAQPIAPELVAKLLGNRVAVSPIVTVEPRRRKFHKPITLTIPVPQAATKGMINQYSGDAPTLRLLCSITGSTKSGGSSKAQWEDVTGSTPLTFVNDCVSFTTTVSARFWLIDCRQLSEVSRFATELYQEAVYVPFMSKFVIFAKRHDPHEAQLRVFCMTDDKEDKTLETQEHFVEVAKSRDVEVLEGKLQYLEFAGNLIPVTNSGDQLKLSFQAFHENRLPFTIRVKDLHMEPMGRIAFMKEPKVGREDPPQVPICNLNVALPDILLSDSSSDVLELVTLQKKYDYIQEAGLSKPELIHRADLRLSDIARELDKDWEILAHQLEVSDSDIEHIKTETLKEYSEQAIVMLRMWLQKAGPKATGNELEKGLRKINREDIIKTCMFNVELVTDDVEKAVAKVHLDQSGFDVFKEELGSSREASMRRGASLDISYDEQDIMKEAESAAETSSETGSLFERDQICQALPDDKENIHHAEETILFNTLSHETNYQNSTSKITSDSDFQKLMMNNSNAETANINVSYSALQEHSFWPPDKLHENITISYKNSSQTQSQDELCKNTMSKSDTNEILENGKICVEDSLERQMYFGLVEKDKVDILDDNLPTDVNMDRSYVPPCVDDPILINDSNVSANGMNGNHFGEDVYSNTNSCSLGVLIEESAENSDFVNHGSSVAERNNVNTYCNVMPLNYSQYQMTDYVGSNGTQVATGFEKSGIANDLTQTSSVELLESEILDKICCYEESEKALPAQTGMGSYCQKAMVTSDKSKGIQACDEEEEARIRRASKTPPPSPVEFTGKDDDNEEKFKEVSFAKLYPETKEVFVKRYRETEIKSGEIITGVGLLASENQEGLVRLTESETWPSGELDTSQVSLSSLPDDEKSELTTATGSSTAVDGIRVCETAEKSEFDAYGSTHIIQKDIQVTLNKQELSEFSKNEEFETDIQQDVLSESEQLQNVTSGNLVDNSLSDVEKETISSHKSLPDHQIEDSYEKHARLESFNGQKQLEEGGVKIDSTYELRTDQLDDRAQNFTSLAFVNTAFAGAEIIDEVEQSSDLRARSPYEVVRDDNAVISELEERRIRDDHAMLYIAEEKDLVQRKLEKKIETKHRPILQHIPSEISEEDLVEREICSPVTKEFEDEEMTSHIEIAPPTTVSEQCLSYERIRENGFHSPGGVKEGMFSEEIITSKVVTKNGEIISVKETSSTDKKIDFEVSGMPNYKEEAPSSDQKLETTHGASSGESMGMEQHKDKAKIGSLPYLQSRSKSGSEETSADSAIVTTSQSFTERTTSGATMTETLRDMTSSSAISGSSSEFKHRRQVSSLTGQTSQSFNFRKTEVKSSKLNEMNGPGEVEYRAEYDNEHYIKRGGSKEEQVIGTSGISDHFEREEQECSTQELEESRGHYSSVSDDAIDAEIGDILSLDEQPEDDVIERPITPEPPADDNLFDDSMGHQIELQGIAMQQKVAEIVELDDRDTFSSRVSDHQFQMIGDSELEIVVDRSYKVSKEPGASSSLPTEESDSAFEYGMQFEKIEQREEAMDVDSDLYSEEKEPAYAYGMRFERDQDLDNEDAPCYGDLYTHEEEDEESLESGEKVKHLPKADYDILAGRKYFTKNVEFDDLSVSSLQEFEHLEQEMSGRKSSIGSIDSLNGKTGDSKSGDRDDVSMGSLTEFERLERECLEPEKIDPAMQESITQLSEIEEGHESQASEASQENRSEDKDEDLSIAEDYDEHLDKIDEIILQAHGKGDSIDEKLPFQYLITHAQKDGDKFLSKETHVKRVLKSVDAQSIMTQSKVEEDIEQDSLHEDISVKPDSLTDDRHEFLDSLHEDKYGDLDSLQGDIPDVMQDSLVEERIIEEDSLHEMDILPDESSLSLESSLAAADSSRGEQYVKVSIRQSSDYDIDLDSLKELKLGGSFTTQLTEANIGDAMVSSTDSLEQSCSAAHGAFQMESESVMTSSLNSAFTSEDCTMISSTDTLEHEGRITYRFEDIPVDDIENLIQNQKMFMDSEGNLQTRIEVRKVIESENLNGNSLTSHSRTEVILPSPSSVQMHSTVTYTDPQYSEPDGSRDRSRHKTNYESSHHDPDVEVEEIHTTDEQGNPKTIRRIKRVIHSSQKFSSSSSPRDVEEKMKEFLRDHSAREDAGKGLEEIQEERSIDEKGNVLIVRTVQQQMLSQPQVDSKSFKGPAAEHLNQQFVESFQTLDPTENVYEYEKVDGDGNVVKVTQQVTVRPEVHTITFSGSDAHQQMEDYMQQWQSSRQNTGEYEADKPACDLAREGYYQQLVSSSADRQQEFYIPAVESSPQITSSEVIQMGSTITTTTKILPPGLKDISPEQSVMYSTTSISEHPVQRSDLKDAQSKEKE